MLVSVLALGDIADRAGNQRALLGLQWTEADLHRKLGSVFPPAVELQALTHRPHPGLSEELRAVFRVPGTKSFRDQNLNLPPKELLPLVAKQLLHLGIDQHDLSLPVHHDHGIGSRFQKTAELLLGPFPLRDIADCARNNRALLRLQRAQTNLDRKLRAVFPASIKLQTLPHT